MKKALSLVLSVILLLSVFSVTAFAYIDDYVAIEMPDTFIPTTYAGMDDAGYVNVYYEEVYLDNGKEYYTYNTIDMYVEIPTFFDNDIETYYDEEETELLKSLFDGFEIKDAQINKTEINGLDAIVYDVYYVFETADEDGARELIDSLYSEVIILKDGYLLTFYVDIGSGTVNMVSERDRLIKTALSSITLNPEGAENANKEAVIVLAIIVGIIIVAIVIIVFAGKAKKKIKQNKQPIYQGNPNVFPQQQFVPYGTQPQAAPYTTPENEEINNEKLDN